MSSFLNTSLYQSGATLADSVEVNNQKDQKANISSRTGS